MDPAPIGDGLTKTVRKEGNGMTFARAGVPVCVRYAQKMAGEPDTSAKAWHKEDVFEWFVREGMWWPFCGAVGSMSQMCGDAKGWWKEMRVKGYGVGRLRRVLKELDFFFVDYCPSGPPQGIINRQPPTASNRQPPATANQPPAATNCQAPTTANRHQPPIPNHQPPPTTTNRHQLPVAKRQPPTAHRQHMACPWAFLGKLCKGTLFFPC